MDDATLAQFFIMHDDWSGRTRGEFHRAFEWTVRFSALGNCSDEEWFRYKYYVSNLIEYAVFTMDIDSYVNTFSNNMSISDINQLSHNRMMGSTSKRNGYIGYLNTYFYKYIDTVELPKLLQSISANPRTSIDMVVDRFLTTIVYGIALCENPWSLQDYHYYPDVEISRVRSLESLRDCIVSHYNNQELPQLFSDIFLAMTYYAGTPYRGVHKAFCTLYNIDMADFRAQFNQNIPHIIADKGAITLSRFVSDDCSEEAWKHLSDEKALSERPEKEHVGEIDKETNVSGQSAVMSHGMQEGKSNVESDEVNNLHQSAKEHVGDCPDERAKCSDAPRVTAGIVAIRCGLVLCIVYVAICVIAMLATIYAFFQSQDQAQALESFFYFVAYIFAITATITVCLLFIAIEGKVKKGRYSSGTAIMSVIGIMVALIIILSVIYFLFGLLADWSIDLISYESGLTGFESIMYNALRIVALQGDWLNRLICVVVVLSVPTVCSALWLCLVASKTLD